MTTKTVDHTIFLRDYRPPAWYVARIELDIELDVTATHVHARLELQCDPARNEPLRLDGEGLQLLELRLDGCVIASDQYALDDSGLTIPFARDGSVLETRVRLVPERNTMLSGLYLSGTPETGFLLTQCEAQGFRRITFFPDRPDVLSRYCVTLRADKSRFPILLANGNPSGNGDLPDGRHWARWDDPHPKPSYLFALVAGRLERLSTDFITAEGRRVAINIWTEPDYFHRCGYALDALQRAMRWDEQHYGRCYDLDVLNLVATPDFNMGAMENKGLNIFNAKYLVADPERSTDEDYRHVEAIVAHEYFHNWTGNRVTCRDWFQLSLKEGLTVFREQQFSAEMGSPALKRIEDVQLLRRLQFSEDAGPLTHPVRPDRYAAIDNFYTATVYDKGAELIRMIAGCLGEEGWRRGMDEYFRRHDGGAATIEQFLAAIGAPNKVDLSSYLNWYTQAGTPLLHARGEYDAKTRSYTLNLRQHTPPTRGQTKKSPLPIPLRMALLDPAGRAVPLRLAGEVDTGATERVLAFEHVAQSFCFVDVNAPPRPSLLRGFSAPVILDAGYTPSDLAFLLRHESDGYNRWEAAQQLARLAFRETLSDIPAVARDTWIAALTALDDDALDPALLAELWSPPDALELAILTEPFDPAAVYAARESLEAALAATLGPRLRTRHAALVAQERGDLDGSAQARRRLANRCLALWAMQGDSEAFDIATTRFKCAPTMTERLAALTTLARHAALQTSSALADFERRYGNDAITLDKWFTLQATVPRTETVEHVATLLNHPRFSLHNPNCVYALLRSFAAHNLIAFHRVDGAGYALIEHTVAVLDEINPQIAARVATTLKDWRRLEPHRRTLLHATLQRLAATTRSCELGDILDRALTPT